MAAVFVPTGYGELLYGVEGTPGLVRLKVVPQAPALYACEPESSPRNKASLGPIGCTLPFELWPAPKRGEGRVQDSWSQ